MIKFDLNWLNLGTPLFLITYINLTIFITNIFQPHLLLNINQLLNTITNNFISNTFGQITYSMIINLYWFYFYPIATTTFLFCTTILLLHFGKIFPSRLGNIIGWLLSLLIHQFNIMLIAFTMKPIMFHDMNYLNIIAFLLFTYIYLNSHDSSQNISDA
ncbi:hypothetical protein E4290_12585 [Staphylococcus pseudintermedius]|nr:hypothetical protein [Staphylococcus pseudintermedius]